MAWQIEIVIGVIVFIVILLVLIAVNKVAPGLLEDLGHVLDVLGSLLDCCSFFSILVVASMVMIGGLVLWHSLLLAAGAGASIMTVILFGWCVALRKQFLARRKS